MKPIKNVSDLILNEDGFEVRKDLWKFFHDFSFPEPVDESLRVA